MARGKPRGKRKDVFGDILTQLREEAGMTQQQAADASGVNKRLIWSWEMGRVSPTLRTLDRLLAVYGYEIEVMRASVCEKGEK
jgi:transcriptional regulator with XRE-family HTH domain